MEAGTPPSAGIYDFLGWCETNKKRIGIGIGALVVIGLIVGFIVWQKGQREIDAEHALSSIRVPFSPSEPTPPGTGDALAKVAEEYSGTPAAAKATLRAGTAYFAENNYAKAQEQFDRILREYGESVWVPQAVFGIAATLEAQGKTTDAISRYKDFSEKYSADPAADQAKLNLARLYEQTQQAALAFEVLKKMTEGQAGFTPGAQEAQERMRALLAKHPELMPAPQAVPGMNVFSNLAPATNIISLTNLMSRTNTGATGIAPRILQPVPTNNAAK